VQVRREMRSLELSCARAEVKIKNEKLKMKKYASALFLNIKV
jgi:hypothetical protein